MINRVTLRNLKSCSESQGKGLETTKLNESPMLVMLQPFESYHEG